LSDQNLHRRNETTVSFTTVAQNDMVFQQRYTVYWELSCILWHLLFIHGGQPETPHTSFEAVLRERHPVVKEITGLAAQSGEP
jgi:hypothetical protein